MKYMANARNSSQVKMYKAHRLLRTKTNILKTDFTGTHDLLSSSSQFLIGFKDIICHTQPRLFSLAREGKFLLNWCSAMLGRRARLVPSWVGVVGGGLAS